MIKFKRWNSVLILAWLFLVLSIFAVLLQTSTIDKNLSNQYELIYEFLPAICLGVVSAIFISIAKKFQKKALCEEFALCVVRKLEQYGGTAKRVETCVRNTEENIEIDIFIYGSVPQYTEAECRRSFNRRAADIYRLKNKYVLFNFQIF